MRFLRHLLALGLVAGCAYLYYQKKNTADSVLLTDVPADSAANWDLFDQAPSFNASTAAETLTPPNNVPQPIPFPEGGKTDLVANLINWSETVNKDLSKTLTQQQQPLQDNAAALTKKTNSLWNEPSVESAQQKLTQQLNDSSSQLQQSLQQPVQQLQKQVQSQLEETGQAIQETLPVEKLQQAAEATSQIYRQFSLGVGERKILCVVDPSVSQDGLLLSTLFAGLRREWISDVNRSREESLIMLIADADQAKGTAHQQELLNRAAELKPARIVHVTRGQDVRGWLRFSSDEESIAALMSVPGVYKIEKEKTETLFRSFPATENTPVVRVELPQNIATQEGATVSLLTAALAGNWSEQRNLPYTGQITSNVTAPATETPGKRDTTSSFFQNLYDNTLGAGTSQATPTQSVQPSLKQQASSALANFLGQAEPFPKEEAQESSAMARVNETVPLEQSPAPAVKTDSAGKKSHPAVELLPPPATYQPNSANAVQNSREFVKLPPPPVGI